MRTNGHIWMGSERCGSCGVSRDDVAVDTEPCPAGGSPAPVVASPEWDDVDKRPDRRDD